MTAVFLFLLFMVSPPAWAVDGQLKRAIDLTYNAQFDEAEAIFGQYIAAHPGDPNGYMVRGTARDWKQNVLNLRGKASLNDQILEDYKKANDMAFQLWNRDQDNIDKMVGLGNSYMYLAKKWIDLGKTARAGLTLKKAKKHMEKAIEKDPNRYDAYLALGIFNFYSANIPSGLQLIASFLGMTGNEPLGLKYIETAATHENILQNDAQFVLAHAYGVTKKNYPTARTYLDQLHSRFPNNPEFVYLKAEYAHRAKKYEEVISQCGALLAYCRSRSGGCVQDYLFVAHFYSAAGNIRLNRFAEAKPHVEEAQKLNVNQYKDRTAYLHLYMGMILKAEGKPDEALVEFKKTIENGGSDKASDEARQGAKEMGKTI